MEVIVKLTFLFLLCFGATVGVSAQSVLWETYSDSGKQAYGRGNYAEAEKLFQTVIAPSHQEEGCVTYTLHRRIDQPGTYYFIEKWRSQVDLDKHLGSAHIKPALARAEAGVGRENWPRPHAAVRG